MGGFRGRCCDIGNTVSKALAKFEQTGQPFCGSTDPHSAGNGFFTSVDEFKEYVTREVRAEAVA